MNEDNFFSNDYDERNSDIEKDILFPLNQNQDCVPDYFNNIPNINFEGKNIDDFNFKFNDNPNQFKDSLFSNNFLNKDFSQINPIPIPSPIQRSNEESSKQSININNSNNGSNSNSTKDKSQLKNNINSNPNSNIINNPIISLDENLENNENNNNKVLIKKRRPRIHLEDLNLDPETIKNKKFEKIGDKVILSKNQVITEDDKKEIRAIRNRISAQKSRDKKKIEYINLKEQIKSLNDVLNKKTIIINNYEKICCPKCKNKINELNKKILEDNDANSNKYENILNYNENDGEELVLEENNSFFSNRKNSFLGKIPGLMFGLVCLTAIVFCVLQVGQNIHNKYLNQNMLLENSHQGTLRHLSYNMCPTKNDNNISNENDTNNNVPLPMDTFNQNNFLQICHDKFTWDIYTKLKNKKQQKTGNFLRKRNLKDPILDNTVCIDSNNIENKKYSIVNDSKLINNLPINANNVILNDNLSNKIISIYVKDYEALKRYVNGRSLPLQEQIENEAKNSEDGCVYLQLIIPKEEIKSSFDKSGTYSEYENDFFEIRCKIFAYNNYY